MEDLLFVGCQHVQQKICVQHKLEFEVSYDKTWIYDEIE
jgi:hypothetical protein